MSNLGSIPQIPAGTTFSLVAGASWLDQFYVQQPGYPATSLPFLGTVTGGNAVIPLNSVAGITYGSLVVGYGIPAGAAVINVVDSTTNTITLNQPLNLAVGAVATNVPILIYGPPLDLTGVTFNSTVRQSLQSATVLLSASTANGLMVSGGVGGTFGWNVNPPHLPKWPLGVTQVGGLAAVVDIQASDPSGQINDLCGVSGPIPFTILLSAPPMPAIQPLFPQITVGP